MSSRVIALQTGPLTRRQRWWAAVLHAGPRSALHGYTALEVAGLRGWERRQIHVAVPKGVRVPPLAGVVVHESRRFQPADLHAGQRPARMRPDRAAVDAASSEPTPRTGCTLLAAVLQQQLAALDQLRGQLSNGQGIRHRRLLLSVLDDIAGGSTSLADIDFVRMCRQARLPIPTRQSIRTDGHGRRRYLDVTWRRADGRTVVVEVDAGLPVLARAWWEEQQRADHLDIDGRAIVLRFPSVLVRLDPQSVTGQLAQALGGVPALRSPDRSP